MGPFYCPDDKKVYLDMAFFREMQTKLGGGGDFAYAYVIAHEIGHHVQDLLGILEKVDDAKQSLSRTDANALSVRVELQADCLAGVWAANANSGFETHANRHSTSHRDCSSHRRRHVANRGARIRRARQFHARMLGAARAMADDWIEERPNRRLQHFRKIVLSVTYAPAILTV